jgi:hypothetical protein
MAYNFELGELICCLYDEYRALYGNDELAALAADVTLNDLLLRFDVHDIGDDHEYDEFFSFGGASDAHLEAH